MTDFDVSMAVSKARPAEGSGRGAKGPGTALPFLSALLPAGVGAAGGSKAEEYAQLVGAARAYHAKHLG